MNNFKCVASNLTSLIGSPWMVKGNFLASYNNLENLEGGPVVVGGEYSVSRSIKSLFGAPDKVFGIFEFGANEIENFKGFPKEASIILSEGLSVKEIDLEDLPKQANRLILILNEVTEQMETDFQGFIEGSTILIEKNYEQIMLNLRFKKNLLKKQTIQRKKI